MSEERREIITFKGNPMTLCGPALHTGADAPDFQVVDNGLQPVTRDTAAGKVRLITVVPSIDTPVCDTMARRFNQDAAQLPAAVEIYTISLDLPFAQKRWCGAAGTALSVVGISLPACEWSMRSRSCLLQKLLGCRRADLGKL